MTDTAAAAAQSAAPAETHAAPTRLGEASGEARVEQVSAPPAPLSDAPQPLKEAPARLGEARVEAAKPAPSTREALRAAREKVEAAAKDAEAGKGAGDKPAPERGEGGRFTVKDKPAAGDDPAKAADAKAGDKPAPAKAAAEEAAPAPVKRTLAAPERFSSDAKAAWDSAPEPVKAEVDRAIREMTAGIEKHRAGAEKFEKIRAFDEMAAKSGTDLPTALSRYTQMESLLRQNPLKGLEAVCDNIGVSLRQVAEIVLGQAPDQARAQSDQTIRELRHTIQRLEAQVGGVTQHFQRQSESQLLDHISRWAEGWDHFEVFAPHIAAELQAGASDLEAAYQAVLQKHPALAPLARKPKAAPAAEPAPKPLASAAAPDLSAQTEKGSRSIAGAPHAGSDPVTRKPASSIREALRRAQARAG